jgi:hypothetical protein
LYNVALCSILYLLYIHISSCVACSLSFLVQHTCLQINLKISMAKPNTELQNGSRHKARLADLMPCVFCLLAKLAKDADGKLAETAVGPNREWDEGVAIKLQPALCPPFLCALPCRCWAISHRCHRPVCNVKQVCDGHILERYADFRPSRMRPQASRPAISAPGAPLQAPASRPSRLRSLGSRVDATPAQWMAWR